MIAFLVALCLSAAAESPFADAPGPAPPVDQPMVVEGRYLRVTVAPEDGALEEWTPLATGRNQAAPQGMLIEGFGVGSDYLPNRRLDGRLDLGAVDGRPAIGYTYRCQGAHIDGLRVDRRIEALPDEAALRVRWRVENGGAEPQWVAPWVRHFAAPGGSTGAGDRIVLPTLDGIRRPERTGYWPAARNWCAATDSETGESVYCVFDAETLFAFYGSRVERPDALAMGGVLAPRLMEPGDAWETTYRLGYVRGLDRVDFATDELAAQVDAVDGRLAVTLVPVRPLPPMALRAAVLAPNGRRWAFDPQPVRLDPDTPARLNFPWDPPAHGVYEFLAQLEVDGEPYPLGEDTRSPHGGIDTVFAVGDARPAAMPAWTDAPYRLERGARTLERPTAVRDGAAVWIEPALRKVFPSDEAAPAGRALPAIRLALARGESESAQVILRATGDAPLRNADVRVSRLAHETTGAALPAVELARVAFHPVRIPTHFEGPTGEWPDALAAWEPMPVAPGRTQPVWLTVTAPRDARPGRYAGRVTVTAAGMDPVETPVEVEVFAFALPATPHLKTDFGYDRAAALALHRERGITDPARVDAMHQALALDYRVTLRGLNSLPAEAPDYGAALAAAGDALARAQEQGASTLHVPASLVEFPEQLAAANAWVVERRLDGAAFTQLADAPPRPAWGRVYDRLQAWNGAAPAIPAALTARGLSPFLPDGAGIWIAHLPLFDTPNARPLLERAQEEGGGVWLYVDDTPARPYGNLFLDFAGTAHRILFWQAWVLGLEGFHYPGINAAPPGADPWVNARTPTPANGAGLLVYPTTNGPVASIRLAAVRDGIDDYDYLTLFRERIRRLEAKAPDSPVLARARAAYDLGDVVPNLIDFPREPEPLLEKRLAIGRLIEEMDGALAR